jgi:hypothetical protein
MVSEHPQTPRGAGGLVRAARPGGRAHEGRVGRRVPLGIRAEPDLPRGAFGPWPRASASSRDRCRPQAALSASARTRVFHRDGRGRRQDAGRRAHDRAGDREAENPETPPCEGGLSAASITTGASTGRSHRPRKLRSEERRYPKPMPPRFRTPPEAPLADGTGRRLGRSSRAVKDYFLDRANRDGRVKPGHDRESGRGRSSAPQLPSFFPHSSSSRASRPQPQR